MSATTHRRAKYLTFSGLATIGLALVSQVAVTPSAVSVETYDITLHQAPPIQNSTFEDDEGDCPGSPAMWGWHFILTGGEAQFVGLTTTFQTAGAIVTDTFGPPDAKHAYVYTATDDTLLGATASVTGGDPEKVRLVLSHTCDGGGTTGTPSPTPSVTPSETVSPTQSVSPTETVSPTQSVSPTETVSPTQSVSPTESVSPSASVSATATESESPVPSATVSGVKFTNTPSVSVSPSVRGVRQTRGPRVDSGGLPTTGNTVPVGLLLALGFGLVAAGVVSTVAGEPRVAGGGKHRA